MTRSFPVLLPRTAATRFGRSNTPSTAGPCANRRELGALRGDDPPSRRHPNQFLGDFVAGVVGELRLPKAARPNEWIKCARSRSITLGWAQRFDGRRLSRRCRGGVLALRTFPPNRAEKAWRDVCPAAMNGPRIVNVRVGNQSTDAGHAVPPSSNYVEAFVP